jgi:hypothetical protein
MCLGFGGAGQRVNDLELVFEIFGVALPQFGGQGRIQCGNMFRKTVAL